MFLLICLRDELSVNIFDTGSVYVYVTLNDGVTWSATQKLLAVDGEEGDLFGVAVTVYNSTIVVGARGDDNANGLIAGKENYDVPC